ncbi:MobV family relaxase [Bilophila wadsworthia]|uniref:MobV family relaxase n=1 Tax=Bilophila wadsworthia TaxID=35833 RepID=UPI00242B84DF|nr:MobV family relaxase [Bilophila wadsworthia]
MNPPQTITPRPSRIVLTICSWSKAVRKDAVHLCGLIVSSDKSFFTRIGKDETRRFFKEAAAYLTNFVGKENVISAVVHTDEKTPHMHFLHVPVTPDGRLSANRIYTRASLKKLQTDLPTHLQSRGFDIQRGVEQKPGAAKKHLDTREFKQQQEALNNLILESEELAQSSRQILDALEQREEELKKNIEMYERQAEEAEKILREDSSLPKASLFNYQSVLKKASLIIAELKKALAVTHITQKQKENLQMEMEELREKQARLETEYAAHKKQSHEEKDELEAQLKKMKRLMAGYLDFLRQPEIRPLHLDFVERKRAEQLQCQQERERQEAEALQQSEREQHIRQQPETVPQHRRSRMR